MKTSPLSLQPRVMESALNALRYRWPDFQPAAGLILGSGWSETIQSFTVQDDMEYRDIPGLGSTGVAGHTGRLLRAEAHGVSTAIFQGRRHWYEGEGWTPVALPIYLLSKLGAHTVLLTNAAGGIAEGLNAGDLMLIRDHIHFIGSHPLIGPSLPDWGPRFPDQSAVYHPSCREHLRRAATAVGVTLKEGVYLSASGPTYETPAEVAMFARMGADAVGMSTTPEAILANAAGLRVAALSCISNLAAGRSPTPLSHEEVAIAAEKALPQLRAVIAGFWAELAKEP
ncbi:MAG: purine-nucleoside phosphorylase [Kiritimatiellae bacterium]|nr:purine-nucleoside phosphorylase [Kiritimatiellia bacterium]